MRILVVGGSGYLGREVVRQAARVGHDVVATYATAPASIERATWRHLDVVDRGQAVEAVAEAEPDVIITAVARQNDWQVTAGGPANVAAAASERGIRIVHVSSDAVFSGRDSQYSEDALPDPVTPYGAAKAAAETAVGALAPGSAIVRTSLIIGDGESEHERFIKALARRERAGALFTDELRCPVHVADLASALLELAVLGERGVRHVAGADALSRYELGCLVARRAGLDPSALRTARRADLEVPGPIRVRLDCERTQAKLGTRLRGVREFLATA